jgi:predicted LPLAT superfamily acyltransferase
MKETNKHYHLYTRLGEVKNRDAQALLENFIQSLEGMLKVYPLQWFNFFQFWKKDK